MGTFNGQLNANEVFGSLFNMILSMHVWAPEISKVETLASKARVDGGALIFRFVAHVPHRVVIIRLEIHRRDGRKAQEEDDGDGEGRPEELRRRQGGPFHGLDLFLLFGGNVRLVEAAQDGEPVAPAFLGLVQGLVGDLVHFPVVRPAVVGRGDADARGDRHGFSGWV